ncbi:carbohydrate sulfotransferase 11-like [Ctenocephalides felis]|uniref:carbohydrate sulfotransferase 11-like n=1 Tax=Ctenocephalides felis TaxID=7515 RepID=UPI000E6E21E3|nr:carbohydrate sulfotransferase 11-like [Ctenocephalides felis]
MYMADDMVYVNDNSSGSQERLAAQWRLSAQISPRELHKQTGERMEARKAHLQEACSRLGLDVPGNDTLHRPNPWEFLVNREHHIVWCNVFKAASTSWMYNFNLLAGYSKQYLRRSNTVPLTLARRRYPRPSLQQLQQALDDSISFLVVRHPLERLLSAYRDKMQFALPHTLHQKLGARIIVKYRKPKVSTKCSGPRWPTFSEFTNYLVDERKARRPLDMHWTPITEFCTPCQLRFDVIAKVETLKDDQQYLIEEAHLQKLITPQWKNSGKGKTTTQLVAEYYSQLTKKQIMQLYDIYRYDFELFNYTLTGYIEHAISEPQTELQIT